MRNFVGFSQVKGHDDRDMIEDLKESLLCILRRAYAESAQTPAHVKNHARHSCALCSGDEAGTVSRDGYDRSHAGSLFDAGGRRKYLNADERERFIAAAATFNPQIEALCLLLHFTGCRISEALALRAHHLHQTESMVILQTLKQRKSGVFRSVPVPGPVIEALLNIGMDNNGFIFRWHRSTAWEKICAVFAKAEVSGPQATPRGTRHGFGVAAVSAGVPVTLVQSWLGHSRLETTAIYLAMTGPEELRYARMLWLSSGFGAGETLSKIIATTQKEKSS